MKMRVWLLCRLILCAVAVVAVSGCGQGRPRTLLGRDVGYKIDTSRNTVTWVTWDAGNGRREWPVAGADAKSFQPMTLRLPNGQQDFGRDNTHVYYGAKRIDGADPDSFRNFGDRSYRDDESVFLWVNYKITQIPESDPKTFEVLNVVWSKDANRVFFENRGFTPRDMASFELLEGLWARDRIAIYYGNREISQAHRDTFEVLVPGRTFGIDRDHVFWEGRLVDGADPKTFVGKSLNEGHDHKTSFYFILKDERNYGPEFRDKEHLEIIRRPVEEARAGEKP